MARLSTLLRHFADIELPAAAFEPGRRRRHAIARRSSIISTPCASLVIMLSLISMLRCRFTSRIMHDATFMKMIEVAGRLMALLYLFI